MTSPSSDRDAQVERVRDILWYYMYGPERLSVGDLAELIVDGDVSHIYAWREKLKVEA